MGALGPMGGLGPASRHSAASVGRGTVLVPRSGQLRRWRFEGFVGAALMAVLFVTAPPQLADEMEEEAQQRKAYMADAAPAGGRGAAAPPR